MEYKLVMLDVDGTLVADTDDISPRVKTAIQRVQQLGVTVSLCTGRLVPTCQQIVEELQLNSYGVYYSGALLKNLITGVTLQKYVLHKESVREVIGFARERHIYLETHTEETYFYELQNSYSDFQRDTLGIEPIYADMLDIAAQYDVLKLQFITESADALAQIETFKQRNGHVALSSGKAPGYPTMTFTNVIPAGVSKGTGILAISQATGIDLKQIIAVGDSIGDIEALQIAGLGVAMGNSEAELFPYADYVTSSVWDDGVAEVLEQFILHTK